MANESVTVTLSGFKELDYALKELGPRIANKLASRSLKAGAEVIASRMRSTVAVSDDNEPHIKDNIITLVLPAEGESERHAQVGFTELVRWRVHWLEFGTMKMIPKPFIRPAIDSEATTAIEIMGDRLWEDISQEVEGLPLGRV